VAQHDYPKPKLESELAAPHGDKQPTHGDGPSNSTYATRTTPIASKSMQSQLCPQLPTQPHPNPNNRSAQLVQIMENGEGETSSVGWNKLRLRSDE
jgi:hypothetical protein